MFLFLRLCALIAGAILGGVVARALASDLTLLGMAAGAMLGWVAAGVLLARRLRKDKTP